MSLFVKVCGITRHEDAAAAAAHGAAAIGFIFWPGSPRWIDPDRAREIVAELPGTVMTVGVFVNQSAEAVNRTADRVGLRAVQLHGDEDPAQAASIERPVLKAIVLDEAADLAAATSWPSSIRLLVDAGDRRRRGGTGRTANWARAAELATVRPIVLAGGLTPENVPNAIRQVRPFGLDVSSSVERAPGIKDHLRIAALFAAVAAAESLEPLGDRE